MTEDRLPLAELLAKAGDGDFLRGVAETVMQMMMEADVEGVIGAGRHERTGNRTTTGTATVTGRWTRAWAACNCAFRSCGRAATSRPSWSRGETTEKALVAVIQEAWISGVSTRRVDELVQAMGLTGIGKSQVPSCARTSTSGSAPSSTGRSPASGRICGWTPPTSSSARAGASSRWRR